MSQSVVVELFLGVLGCQAVPPTAAWHGSGKEPVECFGSSAVSACC